MATAAPLDVAPPFSLLEEVVVEDPVFPPLFPPCSEEVPPFSLLVVVVDPVFTLLFPP